jgi:hypothetical protein
MDKIREQQDAAANGNGDDPAPTDWRSPGYRSQKELEEIIAGLEIQIQDLKADNHDLEHKLEQARQNIVALTQRSEVAESHEREASRAERLLRRRVVELAGQQNG